MQPHYVSAPWFNKDLTEDEVEDYLAIDQRFSRKMVPVADNSSQENESQSISVAKNNDNGYSIV